MASTCVTSLDLCAIRVARLTDAGAPLTGANNGYISADAPVSLGVSVTTEAGDDLTQKNGCGQVAATFQQPDQLKGIELTLTLCQLDAELIEILTGAEVIMSGGNAVGLRFPAVGDSPPPICFEGWTKAWDSDHQWVAPITSPDATWVHWVFPLTRWVQGDFTLEHGLLTYPVTAKGSENASLSINGAYDDFPAYVATSGGANRMGNWWLDTAAPPATCTYQAVTSAAS